MNDYPYDAPILLDDFWFLSLGGETGTSSALQRAAAYMIAEKQMTEHLDTFLVPTIITGTYYQPTHFNPVVTGYGHVNRLIHVSVNTATILDCSLAANDACAIIRNDTYGYVDVSCILSLCGCSYRTPYNIQIVYEAGLPSGTSLQPDLLLGLVIAAQINLNEMDSHTLHNEGAYDIGVQQFSSQGYSEQRVKLGRNAFGQSAAAQKIANLVKGYVHRPGLRFH